MTTPTAIAQDVVERAAEALSGDMSPSQIAGVALELSALITELGEHLEPLKERLREVARESLVSDGRSSGKVSLNGECPDSGAHLGDVWVTFPEPKMSINTKDPDALKKALGDNFGVYFETKVTVTPRRGAKQLVSDELKAGGSRAKVASAVLENVSLKESTPRVGFRPVPDILVADSSEGS